MAIVIFYEKPGCINNTKQKMLLRAAGHEVLAHNLLTTTWTPDRLRQFFGDLPVAEWFNRSAPQIKSGKVVPEQTSAEVALALMVNQPLLIRRPLIQVGDRCKVGFEVDQIDAWIGLSVAPGSQPSIHANLIRADLQTCPRQSHSPTRYLLG